MSRQNLLTLKAGRDLIFTPYRGSGAGGQNRNKVYTAIRLTHPASGVEVRAQDERHQAQNKRIALRRLAAHPKFKLWLRTEVAARLAGFRDVDHKVDQAMRPGNLRVEVGDGETWRVEG